MRTEHRPMAIFALSCCGFGMEQSERALPEVTFIRSPLRSGDPGTSIATTTVAGPRAT